jgi:hypothetical protein
MIRVGFLSSPDFRALSGYINAHQAISGEFWRADNL